MRYATKYIYYLCMLLFLLQACTKQKKAITEGRIKYSISYKNIDKDSYIASALPNEMIFTFDEENTVNEISDFFGVFVLKQIYNAQNNTFTTTVKLLDKKYIYKTKTVGPNGDYYNMKNMRLEFIDKTKKILNFECKKALAYYNNSSTANEVYYTNSVKVNNPNIYNPYKDIDGILMKFRMIFYHFDMEFMAVEFVEEEVDKNTFNTPSGYKPVSKNELKTILDSFKIEE